MVNTDPHPSRKRRLSRKLTTVSWRDLVVVVLPVVVAMVVLAWVVTIFRPAPPNRIKLISGPEGSIYRTTADRYRQIIERYGVKVEILPSRGALDNLKNLVNPRVAVDVGFVQGGLTDGVNTSELMSLGTLFTQPLMVYYRLPKPIEILSPLKGKRLAIGPEGSGARVLALNLLKANDIDAKNSVLLDLGGQEAARALILGTIDAAFLMGDSANLQVIRGLRAAPGVELLSFRQAAGYVRKFHYLSRLTLPEGSLDLGKDEPPHPHDLVGPAVELVARKNLHPALSDLLISAAREVHGGPGLFRDAGDFPAPVAHDFPLSTDAERYYKSGGQFLYKRLPFWLASLVDRLVVIIVPLLVLIIPATRVAPALYRWRVRSRIYRWYGALMSIEREMTPVLTAEQRGGLRERLDAIERAVNEIRTPLAFADQLYVLRGHVNMVRGKLAAQEAAKADSSA